jgi:hypothetical protein
MQRKGQPFNPASFAEHTEHLIPVSKGEWNVSQFAVLHVCSPAFLVLYAHYIILLSLGWNSEEMLTCNIPQISDYHLIL